jgi:hypothetical protein
VEADPDCRGPLPDPAAALASLRERYPDTDLAAAGLLVRAPGGEGVLEPTLRDPEGAVVALRWRNDQDPFALLTARGCLSGGCLPVFAVGDDAHTKAVVREASGRYGGALQVPDPDGPWEPPPAAIFATSRIREVALLRSLGLAATLSLGLEQASIAQLLTLKATFSYGCSPKKANGWVFWFGTGLAFLGWDVLTPCDRPPPDMVRLAEYLKACRKHLNLDVYRLAVWRPPPEWVERLRFWLRFRDAALVRAGFWSGWREQLSPLKSFVDPATGPARAPAPGAGFGKARANLVRLLGEDRRCGGVSEGTRAAARAHEERVQRDLIEPLLEWAWRERDPVVRNLGVELASVCEQLHRATPVLHALQASALERGAGRGGGEETTHPLVIEHARQSAQLASLLKALCQLRRAL